MTNEATAPPSPSVAEPLGAGAIVGVRSCALARSSSTRAARPRAKTALGQNPRGCPSTALCARGVLRRPLCGHGLFVLVQGAATGAAGGKNGAATGAAGGEEATTGAANGVDYRSGEAHGAGRSAGRAERLHARGCPEAPAQGRTATGRRTCANGAPTQGRGGPGRRTRAAAHPRRAEEHQDEERAHLRAHAGPKTTGTKNLRRWRAHAGPACSLT